MPLTILITGATDGIGLETARLLAAEGHNVLMHGRSKAKLDAARLDVGGMTTGYLADLSNMTDVVALADVVEHDFDQLDILINNAGVLKAAQTVTQDGLDLRFMVNAIAPFVLTQRLLSLMPQAGRVINLSSAAQASVNLAALNGDLKLGDMEAYSQSKLAITMWSRDLAQNLPDGPSVLAVNPGSLLASKMVTEGFGVAGHDISIGAKILRRAALSPDFADVSGRYFDNDAESFSQPHPDALDVAKVTGVVDAIKAITSAILTD